MNFCIYPVGFFTHRILIFRLCVLLFFFTQLLFIGGCRKEEFSVPIVETNSVSQITQSSALVKGNITSSGDDTITVRGFIYSTEKELDLLSNDGCTLDSFGTGKYYTNIKNLLPGITYYVKAYATNTSGTGYGLAIDFTTVSKLLSDIEGNAYNLVTIGTQVWMAENLKTTKFNDGTSIPLVTDSAAWFKLTTPGYCWYDNNINYKNIYGALYNWYTVNTGKLCPTGWHVPKDTEWTTLMNYLGGDSVAAGKLRNVDITHWNCAPSGCTNETGFTALPGGHRNNGGPFYYIGADGFWWSSTRCSDYHTTAYSLWIYCGDPDVFGGFQQMGYGHSVRCLKD